MKTLQANLKYLIEPVKGTSTETRFTVNAYKNTGSTSTFVNNKRKGETTRDNERKHMPL
jgi:hypothetical protein